MHPNYDAGAIWRGTSSGTEFRNRFRRGQDWLEREIQRKLFCRAQTLDNIVAVFGDGPEDLFPIKMLASGEEPNLLFLKVDHIVVG
jgi:hypothetical protein